MERWEHECSDKSRDRGAVRVGGIRAIEEDPESGHPIRIEEIIRRRCGISRCVKVRFRGNHGEKSRGVDYHAYGRR